MTTHWADVDPDDIAALYGGRREGLDHPPSHTVGRSDQTPPDTPSAGERGRGMEAVAWWLLAECMGPGDDVIVRRAAERLLQQAPAAGGAP